MEAYSDDLRERVVEAYDKGVGSLRELAQLFGVSRSWIGKLLKLRRERGSIAAIPQRHGPPRLLSDEQRDRLIELAGSDPNLTLAELRSKLRLRCSLSLVCRELKRAGFTFKKRRSTPASNAAKTSAKNARVGVAA